MQDISKLSRVKRVFAAWPSARSGGINPPRASSGLLGRTRFGRQAIMRDIGHFIAGKPVAGSGRFGDVFNPAAGEVTARVSLADAAEVDRAVAAAAAAWPAWAATPPL